MVVLGGQSPAGAMPSGTAEHVPFPLMLQAWQAPQFAELQQTPSVQVRPEAQSDVVSHMPPCGTLPHFPFTQLFPFVQSLSVWQVVKHPVVPLHWKGAHWVVVAAAQTPAAVQVRALVVTAPMQLAGMHTVPVGYFWQAPLPSHTPFVPQDAAPASLHVPAGSLLPAGTLEHVPSNPFTLQALHAPVQVVLQQTPWAQCPDWHWLSVWHVRPAPSRPQEPLTH